MERGWRDWLRRGPRKGDELDVAGFRRSLDETLEWCARRFDMANLPHSLRSAELRPPGALHEEDDAPGIVAAVITRRREALPGLMKEWPRVRVPGSREEAKRDIRNRGRLVAYEYDSTTVDGTSPAETGGFFDDADAPPWDSWVACHEGYVVAWVPANMVSAVDQAIAVNATECIDVGAPTVIHPWTESGVAISSGAQPLSAMRARGWPNASTYTFSESHVHQAEALFPAVLKHGDTMQLPLRRFNQAYARTAPEDRLIDLTIALESSLLAGTKDELKYRLAQRGAFLLRAERDPTEVFAQLKHLYDCRSNIVHNGAQAASLTKDIAKKTKHRTVPEFVAGAEDLVRAVLRRFIQRLEQDKASPKTLAESLESDILGRLR